MCSLEDLTDRLNKQTTGMKLIDILSNEDSGQNPESCVQTTQYQYINVLIKFINLHQK